MGDYRNTIYAEFDEFFGKLHEVVENLRMQKQAEMEEVFKKLKVDDLSDLDKYNELRKNVERAMTDM